MTTHAQFAVAMVILAVSLAYAAGDFLARRRTSERNADAVRTARLVRTVGGRPE
jgi:hypothetical protein